MSHKIPAF